MRISKKHIIFLFLLLQFHSKSQWNALPKPPLTFFNENMNCLSGTLYLPYWVIPVSEHEIIYEAYCYNVHGGSSYICDSKNDLASSALLFSNFYKFGTTAIVSVSSLDENSFVYALYEETYPSLYFTENKFATRVKLISNSSLQLSYASCISPNYVYSVDYYGSIGAFYKKGSQKSFTPYNGYAPFASKLKFINDSVGFLLTRYSSNFAKTSLLKYSDFGKKCEQLITDSIDSFVDYQSTENGIIYLLKKSGVILQSNNQGLNFSVLSSTKSGTFSCIHFVDSLTGFIGGETGLLLKTMDGGLKWSIEKSNTNNQISNIYSFGKSLFFIDRAINVYKYAYIPATYMSLSVFPNPFENTFTISFDYVAGDPGTFPTVPLEIYNINGVKIVEMKLISTSTKIDFSQFPAGVYYLKATSGESVFTTKIIRL